MCYETHDCITGVETNFFQHRPAGPAADKSTAPKAMSQARVFFLFLYYVRLIVHIHWMIDHSVRIWFPGLKRNDAYWKKLQSAKSGKRKNRKASDRKKTETTVSKIN